jgi:hypothetical protein
MERRKPPAAWWLRENQVDSIEATKDKQDDEEEKGSNPVAVDAPGASD